VKWNVPEEKTGTLEDPREGKKGIGHLFQIGCKERKGNVSQVVKFTQRIFAESNPMPMVADLGGYIRSLRRTSFLAPAGFKSHSDDSLSLKSAPGNLSGPKDRQDI